MEEPAPTGTTAGRGALLGAMFLMATSAIGPGFITQTTVFTQQLGAAFAFAILLSIIVDIAVQLNVWRVIGIAGMHAQDLANKVLPGAGHFLAVLVVLGGLVFNIGNIGGTALGMNAMFGMDVKLGGAISAVIAIAVFAAIFGLPHTFIPLMTLPIYTTLERLDLRYVEAGGDLYASPRSTFFRVTLPLRRSAATRDAA